MDKILQLLAQLQAEVEALKASTAVFTQADLDQAVQGAVQEAQHNADEAKAKAVADVQAQLDQANADKSALQAQVDSVPAAITKAVEELKAQELVLEEKAEEALAALKAVLVPAEPKA